MKFRSLTIISIIFSLSYLSAQAVSEVKPWIGIAIEKKQDGVLVKQAIAGTPAEKAGLKPLDIIKKIDSKQVQSPEELISYVQSKGVGNEVTIEYLRDNIAKKLTLKLEAKPDQLELVKKQVIGKKFPEISLETIEGKNQFTNKNLENKVTVLEFWATWCGPCRQTHERLSKFSKENPNIAVIAASDESMDLIQNYAKAKKFNFKILRDSKRTLHDFFIVSSIPMSVVVDKKGIIQSVAIGGGFYLEDNLKKAIELDNTK
ncbi:MAG: redoxin domain-containing protein [Leptospiraceae bacterium]|nr:redoxin domain-containing protein [Leptospiraceae bacterium]